MVIVIYDRQQKGIFLDLISWLFQGDIIAISYNKKIYELNVLETKPATAVSIIECDMNVEFEAPPGYVVGK